MNAASRLVMGVLVVVAPLGCSASKPLKLYPGPVLPPESLAVVMTSSPSAYLHSIRGNGVKVGIDPRDGPPMNWAGNYIELPAGTYTIKVGLRGGLFESRDWTITKQLEAGHRYEPRVRGSKAQRVGTLEDMDQEEAVTDEP